jgi:hypothetical protein
MIFNYVLATISPRLVKIQHSMAVDENGVPRQREINVCSGLSCKFTSPWLIPPLLHACSRSRYIALKRWPLCFANQGQRSWDPVEKPKIFFDMGRDTLYLGEGSKVEVLREWVRRFGTRAERAKVQYIALELKYEGLGMGLDDVEGAALAQILHDEFPGLVEVMFGAENLKRVEEEVNDRVELPDACVGSDARVYVAFQKAKYKLRWNVLHHLVPQLRLDLGDWYFENGEMLRVRKDMW